MTPFSEQGDGTAREDFRLLQHGHISLVHAEATLAAITTDLAALGYRLDTIDCRVPACLDFHNNISHALSFPSYYGRNLDAMNDCLSDLEFPGDAGRAIILRGFDHLFRYDSDFATAVLDILNDQAGGHRLCGHRLIILAQSDDPMIELSLPAKPIKWNEREWQRSTRGTPEAGRAPAPRHMLVWYMGDCFTCGAEGELVLCLQHPGPRAALQCAECHQLWHDPAAASRTMGDFVIDGSTWPMTWGQIEHAGWTHLARHSMELLPGEWPTPAP